MLGELSTVEWMLFFTVAVCVGLSKTGVHGAGNIAVPLLAIVFGGKLSSGIMLPMLCLADVMGVIYYHRHTSWPHLKKLVPAAVVGIVIGTFVGEVIAPHAFDLIMVSIIFVSVGIMIWIERGRHEQDIPDNRWFANSCGVGAGFTSMIGNLAGAFSAVYLLAMRLPKNAFIGTSAWFFLIINWIKVPFHVFRWHTIKVEYVILDLVALPLIAVGALFGIFIVKKLSEVAYRWFIIVMTLAAAVFMALS